jgi:hypothetical protein
MRRQAAHTSRAAFFFSVECFARYKLRKKYSVVPFKKNCCALIVLCAAFEKTWFDVVKLRIRWVIAFLFKNQSIYARVSCKKAPFGTCMRSKDYGLLKSLQDKKAPVVCF